MQRFSFWDLLVGLFCGICVAAFLFPSLHRTHEVSWNLKCESNLRQIGQGLTAYANDNHGNLPRTRYDPNLSQWNSFTNPNGSGPFANDGPQANDVTAALYLLIRGRYVPSEAFRCPATEFGSSMQPEDSTAMARTNFLSPELLGYSIANPYPDAAAVKAGYRWTSTLSPDFPVAGDLNPGPAALSVGTSSTEAQLRAANTPNDYSRHGENLLYGDGHVELVQNPFAGFERDNIYTYGASTPTTGGVGVVGSPTSAAYSVLLPVATTDVRALEYPWVTDRRVRIIDLTIVPVGVTLLVAAVLLFVRRVTSRSHKT